MMRGLLLSLCLYGNVSFAAGITLSWDPATLNDDGSPYTDPAGYVIYYGTEAGEYPNSIPVDNPALTSYVVSGLAGGVDYYFVMTSVNSRAIESVVSGELLETAPLPNPLPPVLIVGEDLTAFAIIESDNFVSLSAVGTVDPGTECNAAQEVLGKHVVNRAAVTWFGNVQPKVVVAQCDG